MNNSIQKTKGGEKPIVLVAYVCPPEGGMSIADLIASVGAAGPVTTPTPAPTPDPGKRYVYGLKGIQDLFGCCRATAGKYKDGILKDACYQSGRKIVVDVEKALALFNGGRAE